MLVYWLSIILYTITQCIQVSVKSGFIKLIMCIIMPVLKYLQVSISRQTRVNQLPPSFAVLVILILRGQVETLHNQMVLWTVPCHSH